MATMEYRVTGMSCGHCEASVREELSKIGAIEQIDVSVKTGKLVISASESIADADVLAAVDEAGYQAVRVG